MNFFEPIYSSLIATGFKADEDILLEEYSLRMEFRTKFGFTSDLDIHRLRLAWDNDFAKIVRRRNWLWHLMKSGQYDLLDEQLGTSVYNDKIVYENKRIAKLENIPIKTKWYENMDQYKYWLIKEADNIDDDSWLVEYYNTPSTYKKKARATSYDKENKSVKFNVWPPYREEIHVQSWYEYIIASSLKLRDAIISLSSRRVNNPSNDLELNEMHYSQRLKYQSKNKPIIISSEKASGINLINNCNKPTCCVYCPSISCLKCFKGEGCCDCTTRYQGNVEQDVGGDTSVVQTDTANNVVLTETEITQADKTALSNIGWSAYTSSDTVSNMETLVNRWFRVGTYEWTTASPRNTTIISIDLPRTAIIAGTNLMNQPNCIPFQIHRFWRGDMIVKIHINCNKFQIGQLQCAWYYQPKADNSFLTKANVYTRSGTHHCVISAAPNNEVELCIPFKSFKSMLHTKNYVGDEKGLALDLGTLYITVLSPLKTTGETSPKCSFTVFVKFINNEFTGMLSGDIDRPSLTNDPLRYQMDMVGSLLNTAVPALEKMLVSSSNDNNRDNPPNVQPPSFLVPTASHSWSIGTDLGEPIHNLRLSGIAQTQHPDTNVDEMKIDVLKRKYMLLDVFTWSQQRFNGEILWSIPVNPLPPKDRMPVISESGINLLASYQLSTIGFLSSLYQYWRGSIEYRFDIVASQFHSGKLMLAYIPGIAEGATVTIDQARASPNIIISLDNAMSYTWRVPYVADRPWWPRRYSGESVSNNGFSPSKVFVFVLNELVLADTVPDNVDILVYIRGGEDMEFSIPVQPSIGLGFDRSYVSSRDNNNVFPVSTTDTYYAGNWNGAPLALVWRHATTSEAVGRFSEPILDQPVYYTLPNNVPTASVRDGGPLVPINKSIFLKGVGFSEYIGLPVYTVTTDVGTVPSLQRLEDISRAAFENNYVYGDWVSSYTISSTGLNLPEAYGFIPPTVSTVNNTYGGGKGQAWVATTVTPTLNLEALEYQGNREESLALIDNTQFLQSTGSGFMTFGERFTDLKDLCRRYQIYGWTSVPAANIERDPGACSFLFPVLPQGLTLSINTPTAVNQIWNRAREGHIPLISSLFRFYRGSIRIRIVTNNASGLTMWVQHRPDRRLERDVITPCTQVTTAEAVFNHTYGLYMQDMDVNRIVEIEVPFYQMSNYGLLQDPVLEVLPTDWSYFYSLGELSVGFFGDTPANDVRCTIYYSIADDCRFSTYQGVPPMILIDDLPEFQQEPLRYQGMFDLFKKEPRAIGEEVAEGFSAGVADTMQPMLDNFLQTMRQQLGDTYSSVSNSISELDIANKMANIASQVLHAVSNPTGTTIAISVTTILLILGVITYSIFSTIKEYVIRIWDFITNKVSSNEVQKEVEVGEEALHFQNESENNAISGFLSLICGGLCALFGIKSEYNKYKCPSNALFKNIDRGMKMSNVCFVFFRNIFSVVGDMKSWIIAHLYPGFNAAESLMNGRDIIEKWINYSQDLFDPRVSQNIKYDRNLQIKVLDCYSFGKILRVKALDTQYPAIIQLVNTTFDKLHKLHVELVAQGLDPHVRKMPFVIYNYGLPEIGKSHLTTDICVELCKSQEIKTETDLMCVLNATSKFWDNCDRQPCLVMDDAFNIRKGPMLEDQMAAIFNIVSPVVLVPPRAAVEDKGRSYNPEIFILNSNTDFFKTDLCDVKALWRRRDILIHSELDADFKKDDCIHCEKNLKVNARLPAAAIESLKDFHHLKFKYTYDVTNNECVYLPENRYLKYPELLELLKEIFAENRKAENIKFASRVQATNDLISERISLVSNVENLEQLWNDAIARRNMQNDLYKNTSLKIISKSFAKSVSDNWEDVKHGVLKQIYSVIRPANNRYFNKNSQCIECVRIKYQCMSCKIKLEEMMKVHSEQPSTSTSSASIEVIDLKFQGNNEATAADKPLYEAPMGLELNDDAMKWVKELSNCYGSDILDQFSTFLTQHCGKIMYNIRLYPKYARSVSVFKSVCEKMCNCIHDCNVNIPFLSDNVLSFINPTNISKPDACGQFNCHEHCWMFLPWKVHQTAKVCKTKFPDHYENWMDGLVSTNIPIANSLLNEIFSKMTKFVFDFYYNIMKPAVKAVFSFFSSFSGWIMGLSFLSILFSTIIMGKGAYEYSTHPPQIRISSGPQQPCLGYQSNSYESGKPKVNKIKRPRVHVPRSNDKNLTYQSAQQFDVVEDRLRNNVVSIDVVFSKGEKKSHVSNHGLMLRDQQMLIQRHYYDYWKRLNADALFFFKDVNRSDKDEYGIPLPNFFEYAIEWFSTDEECLDSNFGILHLPLFVPAYKNITKFIAKSGEHEYIKSDECFLFNCLEKRSMHCNMNVEYNRSVTQEDSWLRLDECYSYKYTREGLCGSVLLCRSLERPIIGIHFAGNTTTGYSEPLVQESFNDIEVKNYSFECHDMYLEQNKPKVSFDTLLYPQGTIPKQFVHHQGSVSQYIPSLVHGVYEVDTEPNPLSPQDPRLPENSSPMKLGCEHMGKPPKDFPKDMLRGASDDLRDVLLNTVIPVRVKIDKLSYQDAICGNVNVKGFEPLEWSSSEGFPLKALRPPGVKGKKWLFDLEETPSGYVLKNMHGELKRQLYICEDLRKQGIRIPTLFTDCLKDTCIDKVKCTIPGKTRIFSISPVQYTIAFKQYFNDFLASYQNNRLNAEHGIGINVDSLEWSEVANHITTYSPYIVAGDYKNFGPSLMLSCVKEACDIIMAWYERYDNDPERQLIRKVLLSELVHAKHLCLNVVYGVPCGIPSGSPITTPLNSIVNSLYLRCAWSSITKSSFAVMKQNIKILTYGDDVCINVSSDYIDRYNTSTLNVFFKEYDIIFTDIDKSDNIINYRTLENVSFLKRGFRRHPHMKNFYLAPIEEQSIRKCVNWITRKGDSKLNTLENCKQACELAFGHGPQYYNRTREFLQHECIKRLGCSFTAPSWFEKSEICYNI